MEFKEIRVGDVLKTTDWMDFSYIGPEGEGRFVRYPAGIEVDVIAIIDEDNNRNTLQSWRCALVSYPDPDLDEETIALLAPWMLEKS